MPFTFSHPAVILPLRSLPGNWVSVTGLVVGSITPDFEKFIFMRAGNVYSHTLPGIFWFNLPLAILLSFLFQQVVRNPVIDHLPNFLQQRFNRFRTFNWLGHFLKKYPVILLSFLTGITSHLFLDEFTHIEGRFISWFPFLAEYFTLQGKYIYYYKTLDLGISLAGAIYIMHTVNKLPHLATPDKNNRNKSRFWLMVILIFGLVAGFNLVYLNSVRHIYDLINVIIGSALLSLFLTCLTYRHSSKNLQKGF